MIKRESTRKSVLRHREEIQRRFSYIGLSSVYCCQLVNNRSNERFDGILRVLSCPLTLSLRAEMQRNLMLLTPELSESSK